MQPVGLRLVDVRVAEERVIRALPGNRIRHAVRNAVRVYCR